MIDFAWELLNYAFLGFLVLAAVWVIGVGVYHLWQGDYIRRPW